MWPDGSCPLDDVGEISGAFGLGRDIGQASTASEHNDGTAVYPTAPYLWMKVRGSGMDF